MYYYYLVKLIAMIFFLTQREKALHREVYAFTLVFDRHHNRYNINVKSDGMNVNMFIISYIKPLSMGNIFSGFTWLSSIVIDITDD